MIKNQYESDYFPKKIRRFIEQRIGWNILIKTIK